MITDLFLLILCIESSEYALFFDDLKMACEQPTHTTDSFAQILLMSGRIGMQYTKYLMGLGKKMKNKNNCWLDCFTCAYISSK